MCIDCTYWQRNQIRALCTKVRFRNPQSVTKPRSLNPQHVCLGLTGCGKTKPGWADMDSLRQVKPVLDKWAHVVFLDRSLLLSLVSRIHDDNESSMLIPDWAGNPQVGFKRGRRTNKAERQHPSVIKQEKGVAKYRRATNYASSAQIWKKKTRASLTFSMGDLNDPGAIEGVGVKVRKSRRQNCSCLPKNVASTKSCRETVRDKTQALRSQSPW